MSVNLSPVIAAEDKAMLTLQDKLDRLLAKAKPKKRDITQQHFRDLYPKLEAHLASGKLLKDVLSAFNGLVQAKVCTRTFNEMLAQERARRDDAGNSVCCFACGHPLHRAQADRTSAVLPPTHEPIDSE